LASLPKASQAPNWVPLRPFNELRLRGLDLHQCNNHGVRSHYVGGRARNSGGGRVGEAIWLARQSSCRHDSVTSAPKGVTALRWGTRALCGAFLGIQGKVVGV